ncbi:MAG: hypothetical protein ACK5KM_03620, partial [Hyphomicrobiaceae bacterium]
PNVKDAPLSAFMLAMIVTSNAFSAAPAMMTTGTSNARWVKGSGIDLADNCLLSSGIQIREIEAVCGEGSFNGHPDKTTVEHGWTTLRP